MASCDDDVTSDICDGPTALTSGSANNAMSTIPAESNITDLRTICAFEYGRPDDVLCVPVTFRHST